MTPGRQRDESGPACLAPRPYLRVPDPQGGRGTRTGARRPALPGGRLGQLRRLQGDQRLELLSRSRRAALHHRPQRRRQDHHDGHHHRQDPARHGHGLVRCAHRTCCACPRPRSPQAGIGRKFQKPTVFEHHTVFENLELAMAGNKGVFPTLFARLSGEQRDRIDEVLEIIGLTEDRDQRRPAPCRTARSSGWRSACC